MLCVDRQEQKYLQQQQGLWQDDVFGGSVADPWHFGVDPDPDASD